MKIGIITFHCAPSYGAFFQAYALAKTVKNLGHSVQVIDYMPEHRVDVLEQSWKYPRRSKHRLGLNRVALLSRRERRLFYNAAKKYLPLSRRRFNSYESLCASPEKYEVCIAGSDQIWNPEHSFGEYDPAYFAQLGYDDLKRVSYAASFGVSELGAMPPCLRQYLSEMDDISVRENSARRMIAEGVGRDAQVVLDPTLLLSPEQYPQRRKRVCSDKYILVYNLQYNVSFEDLAEVAANRFGVKILDLRRRGDFPVGTFPPTPVDVLDLIKNAEFVLTNSYHGMVLSILHNIKFAVVALEGAAAPKTERMSHLIQVLDLSKQRIPNTVSALNECLSASINWESANEKIAEERKRSISFLERALSVREEAHDGRS